MVLGVRHFDVSFPLLPPACHPLYLADFVRAAPGVRLDCIALGPLFPYDTSSWESSPACGPAHSSGPRGGGARSQFGGKREVQQGFQGRPGFAGREVSYSGENQGLTIVPKGIAVMTRIAALMTAYGLTFVEVRGETEVSESLPILET